MKYALFFCFLLLLNACSDKTGTVEEQLSSKTGKEKLELITKLIATDTTEKFLDYYTEGLFLSNEFPDSTQRIYVLCAMGDHFAKRQDHDTALLFYNKALLLSHTQKIIPEEINCFAKTGQTLNELNLNEKALQNNSRGLTLSKKNGTKEQIAKALELIGFSYYHVNEYDTAIHYFEEELKLDEELHNDTSIASCLNNLATNYGQKGDFVKSMSLYSQAIEIKQKLGDDENVAIARVNIGIALKDNGSYELALENLLLAVRYIEKQGPSSALFSCYTTLGNLQILRNELEEAYIYHTKALQISIKINYKRGTAKATTNIGEVLMKEGKYNEALVKLEESLKLKESLEDKVSSAYSLNLIGEIYFLKKNPFEAEKHYRQALLVTEGIDNPKGTAITFTNLGELSIVAGNYDSAFSYLKRGREIAFQADLKDVLLNNYELSKEAYAGKRDFSSALHYADKYSVLHDTIVNEKKNKNIEELKIKYETEINKQQIKLLAETDKINKADIQRQYIVIFSLFIGVGLLLIIVTLALIAYRSRKKAFQQSELIVHQKQALIEQKQVVMRELHHRVKNNLQVLSDMLNLQQIRLKDENTRDALKAVEQRLHAMLLIHRELYNEQDAQVNMKDYLEKLTDNLRSSYGYTKAQLQLKLEIDELKLSAEKALNIGFVCNEVISNSFKHAFKDIAMPALSITLLTGQQVIRLEISDNGSGIPADIDLEKAGSFGLRLIHLFVKDLHGSINIVQLDKGTRFEFIIPHF